MELSIIVPVYKTEKYLMRCVKSLLAQTCHDYEIILVDDGSPDACPAICDQLAASEENIQVIHKKNGGLSSARNAGLDAAKGTYIGFVDSDDTVCPSMFQMLLTAARSSQADIVMSDYVRILKTGEKQLISTTLPSGFYGKKGIRHYLYPSLIMGENLDYGPVLAVWHCLYQRQFLKQYHLRFAEDIPWSEDNLFNAIAVYYARRFFYLKSQGLYHYFQNPGTITSTYHPDAWKVYQRMNRYMNHFFSFRKDFDFSRQLKLHMLYYACHVIRKNHQIDFVRTVLSDLHKMQIFKDFRLPSVPFKLKIQLLLMKYRFAWILSLLIGRCT